jgi:hypothetical protein
MANAGDRLKQKKEKPKKSRRRRKSLLVDVKRQHAKTNEKPVRWFACVYSSRWITAEEK